MRFRYLAAISVLAIGLSAAPARADFFITPFTGVTFSGDTPANRFVYGATFGFTGNSPLGFEIDFGHAPNFFDTEDEFFDFEGKLSITTLMFNLSVGGAPIGGGVRPFVSGGMGLLRGSVKDVDDFFDDVTRNDFALNLGGGLSGYFNDHIGIRGDVRYFRSLTGEDNDGFILDPTEFDLGDFDFWRGSVGVTFKF